MALDPKGLEAAADELVAHGEFSSIPGNNHSNALLAAEAAITAYLQHAGEAKPVAWTYTSKYDGRVEFFPNNDLWKEHGYAERHPDAVPLFAAPHPHQAPEGWRPIETAPKDGTLVLLYNVAHGEQAVMGWTNDLGMPDSFPEGCWTDAGGLNRAINLTVNGGYYQFWQPLPAPPASPSNQASASADQGGE